MPPAAVPVPCSGCLFRLLCAFYPLQIVRGLHRRAVRAGTPRRWGCVLNRDPGFPAGTGFGMERREPFPGAGEAARSGSGSGSGAAEGCGGTAAYFKIPFPVFLGPSVRGTGGEGHRVSPAAAPRCPRAVRSRSPERGASAPLSPAGEERGKVGNCWGKKRSETFRVPSPTLPSSFPATFPVPSTGKRPGGPGRRRMRHLGVSLWIGEKGKVTHKISPRRFKLPLCKPALLLQRLFGAFDSNYPRNSAF